MLFHAAVFVVSDPTSGALWARSFGQRMLSSTRRTSDVDRALIESVVILAYTLFLLSVFEPRLADEVRVTVCAGGRVVKVHSCGTAVRPWHRTETSAPGTTVVAAAFDQIQGSQVLLLASADSLVIIPSHLMATVRAMEAAARPIFSAIRSKLTDALKPTVLDIVDESHKHAGHAGMHGKEPIESHFRVEVVSDAFQGKDLRSRHQMVYQILSEEMKSIHALSLRTRTPAELQKATVATPAPL